MKCDLEFTGSKSAKGFLHRCKNCGGEAWSKYEDPRRRKQTCELSVPAVPGLRLPPPKYPPLSQIEIDRRLEICAGCEYWLADKAACKVCGSCASGQKMLQGLARDPGKRCPHPKGAKWGPNVLRVAFLTPGLHMGGAERWLASLCRHFDRSKILPAYVIVKESKFLSPECKAWFPPDTHVSLHIEHLPAAMKQVDMLVSWGPVDLDSLTKGAKIPIVDACHGTLGHWEGGDRDGFKVQEVIARQAIASGAHLAAVSEECIGNYPSEVRDRVTVIPNGAEVSRVQSSLTKEEARQRFGIPDGQKVVLFVGRFAKEKNLQALVDAMDYLPGWTLLAAGPQHQMPSRTEGKPIIMPGSVDPPADLYRAADVLCMPSFHEAHSLTLIEGNLAGVPVASADYPAMKWLTQKHGPLATLFPPRCPPQEIAAAIELAATATEAAKRIQELSLATYTAEKMALRWQDYLCSKASSK